MDVFECSCYKVLIVSNICWNWRANVIVCSRLKRDLRERTTCAGFYSLDVQTFLQTVKMTWFEVGGERYKWRCETETVCLHVFSLAKVFATR